MGACLVTFLTVRISITFTYKLKGQIVAQVMCQKNYKSRPSQSNLYR
jgi:hypothetical protein